MKFYGWLIKLAVRLRMILVDRRVGSNDLLAPLKAAGFDAQLVELAFGDIAFEGKGPNGTTLNIGVELKVLGDLINSLRTGRLAGHQLPGLLKTYDHAWLLVEGQWRANAAGQVTTQKRRGVWAPVPGKMSASELDKQLLTLELCGGLHVAHTHTRADTVRFLGNLYRWWTDRALDSHTSHLALHVSPTVYAISPFRAAVCQWPGIGLKTSSAVERRFSSIRHAAAAPVEEWAAITTGDRKLGKKTAERVVKFLRGE
jgi:ERCC4-type nuclease